MELSTNSETRHLMATHSPTEDRHSDSELSDDSWLCRVDTVSDSERDSRRLAWKKLLVAGAVSLVFMTGELIGGLSAHSLAVMTDAVHLLTDFSSIAINIFSLWISSRTPTRTMTFGWQRAEVLGVLLSVVSIWAVTAALLVSAVQRISDGDFDVDSRIMLITSGCAVGVNVLMVLILRQSGASHGHSHGFPGVGPQSHSRTNGHANVSVRAAFIHVLGDLLQSVGVLLAATIIHLWPEYKVADPICTFLFSVLVLATTFKVTKDVLRILMEGSSQDVHAVREQLLSVTGVEAVHSLHTWSLNTTRCLLSVHVITDEDADSQIVLTEATKLLHSEFGFFSITIQVERRRTDD